MSDDKMTWLEASQELAKLMDEANASLDEMAENCPHELKIAVTRWAMKHIVEHAKEGGSYRYLIYNRMGFGPEAYVPLCDYGMTISNEFDMEQMDNIHKHVADNKIEGMKPILGMCDEPGCFRSASSGWPTKDGGYRQTCGEHYLMYKKDERE